MVNGEIQYVNYVKIPEFCYLIIHDPDRAVYKCFWMV
jgi:hypothetical protein